MKPSPHSHRQRTVLQLAGFGLLLVAAIGGAALGWPLFGPAVLVALIAGLAWTMKDPVRQLGLATCVGLIGAVVETGLIAGGIYMPKDALPESLLCPLWVISLWVGLGLILPLFAPREPRQYIVVAVCGACCAPLVYLASDDLMSGALHLRRPLWPTLVLLALLWQGLLPALCWLANWRWYKPQE